MSEPRKIPYRAMSAVKEALRQKRQLTPMEVMQAKEVLDVLRHNVLRALGADAPDKRPVLARVVMGDGSIRDADSAEVVRLKTRGLYEIAKHAALFPDDETDFVVALVEEAAHEFARSPSHARGVPPQVAAANAARAARSKDEVTEDRLRALERGNGGALILPGAHDVVDDERVDAIEARLAALELQAAALSFVRERLDTLDNDVRALENAQTAPLNAPTEKE